MGQEKYNFFLTKKKHFGPIFCNYGPKILILDQHSRFWKNKIPEFQKQIWNLMNILNILRKKIIFLPKSNKCLNKHSICKLYTISLQKNNIIYCKTVTCFQKKLFVVVPCTTICVHWLMAKKISTELN